MYIYRISKHIPASVRFMGDPPAKSVGETTNAELAAYRQNLPGLIETTAAGILPLESAQFESSKALSPAYAKLAEELYSTYGINLNRIGSYIDRENKQASAQTDLDILKGSGKDLAGTAQEIDQLLNPEFYQTRGEINSGYNRMFDALNPDNANPEAERLVNLENVRSGNLGNNGGINTVANALKFGDERLKRINSLGAALQGATSFLGSSKASFDPFGRQTGANSGDSKFTGVKSTDNSQAFNMGNALLNQTGAAALQENDINSKRRDVLDRVNESVSSMPNVSI